ncbi:MAG: IPT/TIG domain-containing protein [Deltaproteobacteria bacterium]|nr:IPT/TIG domain-containing protein [Deltaproteobacteria bacterium]
MNAQIPIAPLLLLATLATVSPSCADPAPAVNDINPTFGLMHGGETVVIRGNNIEALMPVTVYMGNHRVTVSKLESRDELWVITPAANLEETVDVRIIGNDGTEFVMQLAFQYVEKAEMAECVNISKQLNGNPVLERKSKRQTQ